MTVSEINERFRIGEYSKLYVSSDGLVVHFPNMDKLLNTEVVHFDIYPSKNNSAKYQNADMKIYLNATKKALE